MQVFMPKNRQSSFSESFTVWINFFHNISTDWIPFKSFPRGKLCLLKDHLLILNYTYSSRCWKNSRANKKAFELFFVNVPNLKISIYICSSLTFGNNFDV